MASASDSSSPKRRPGRRRLPPLEPGPALQFVVASHPDQFRAGKTMRHVRSHVMYKHRTERKTTINEKTNTKLYRSASAGASKTSRTDMNNSNETSVGADHLVPPQSRPRSSTWTGELLECISPSPIPSTLRTLVHEIMSLTVEASARSAPPTFGDAIAFPFPSVYVPTGDPLDELRRQYIANSNFFCHDQQWMQFICADQKSFLSHVCVSCVYQDLADGLCRDSDVSVGAKTGVLSMIAGQLEMNDATILSILHLLLSEAGGGDESAFQVHFRGLQGLVHRRGGLNQLPSQLAAYTTLLLTTLTMLKGLTDSAVLPMSNQPLYIARANSTYISPLYAPHGNLAPLHNKCSSHTLEIINDMYGLTQAFISRNSRANTIDQARYPHQVYKSLLQRPSMQNSPTQDYIYESVRLAALMYTHALLYRIPFAQSASAICRGTTMETATLLYSLLNVLQHTDTTNCWGDIRGVFLWICLIGGAGSWSSGDPVSPQMVWARKCFSLWAIKAVVSIGFEHSDGMIAALRTGVQINNLLRESGS